MTDDDGDDAPGGYILGRIEILRMFTDDGEDQIAVSSVDGAGDHLALVDALGMLRLAEDTVIRVAMEGGDDDG